MLGMGIGETDQNQRTYALCQKGSEIIETGKYEKYVYKCEMIRKEPK